MTDPKGLSANWRAEAIARIKKYDNNPDAAACAAFWLPDVPFISKRMDEVMLDRILNDKD